MSKVTRFFVVAAVLVALFCLTACERIVSGAERDTVLAFSEPTVDNLIAGWTANDYAMFSRNFDADLQEELSATDFAMLKLDMDGKLGRYASRKIDRVARSDEFYVVDYQANFGDEKPVKVTVAFHASDHSIAHFTFDSEEVSWSAFQ